MKSQRPRRRPTPTSPAVDAPDGAVISIDDLRPDPQNARRHPARNLEAIERSFRHNGAGRSVLVDDALTSVAGTGTILAAKRAGVTKVRLVDARPDELVAVRRRGLTAAQRADLAIADNRAGELAEWDPDVLAQLGGLEGVELAAQFTPDELAALLDPPAAEAPARTYSGDPDKQPTVTTTSIRDGYVFELGDHVLACTDCRDQRAAERLCPNGVTLMMIDPPYCSGGFQEAGRAAGTFGKIAADNLSTRGYAALLNAAFQTWRPQVAYVFTDWRMWIPLYDIVEGSGLAVRSMVVWDKGTPGLGALWRTQHELVMVGSRAANKRQKGRPAGGNVIGLPALDSAQAQATQDPGELQSAVHKAQRSGNKLHYTEKPVALLEALIGGDMASGRDAVDVVDVFGGSGTTLIAAERLGRRAVVTEVEPLLCQTIVDRWEGHTGRKAVKVARITGSR